MAAPYRNDHDALMARLTALVDELASLRSRTSALRDLERTERDIERELDEVRREVARVAPNRLPLLERVTIAAPCSADWASMTGDDRARFCGQCQKNVYNIANMTAEDAEALLRETAGEACLRIYRRADGTVLTSDCSVGVRRRRRRRVAASLVGGGLLAAGAAFAFGRGRDAGVAMDAGPMMGADARAFPRPEATTEPVAPVPSQTAAPTPEPRHVAGGIRRPNPQMQLDAEMAHVRNLLDKRARTQDPAQRRALEAEIRQASQRVVQLSNQKDAWDL